jgi:hypothetical protein
MTRIIRTSANALAEVFDVQDPADFVIFLIILLALAYWTIYTGRASTPLAMAPLPPWAHRLQ